LGILGIGDKIRRWWENRPKKSKTDNTE
jgi:hypothetical protein